MKSEIKSSDGLVREIEVEVPADVVDAAYSDAYEKYRKQAKIKGFRPGKAPRKVLERLYKKDVHADVKSRLIQNSFIDALKETDLNIVGDPKLDPPELDAKGPYKYDATVEIRPAIEDVEFKGLTLKKNM